MTERPILRPTLPVDSVTGPSEHYIETTTSLTERVLRTLKEGDAFAVLDRYGDIGLERNSPEGFYFRDTRYLSRWELRLDGLRPLLLGSGIQDDNAALAADLSNPDVGPLEAGGVPRDILAIERTKFLWQGACYERLGLRNYDRADRHFRVEIRFGADFHDLFEARGTKRPKHGLQRPATIGVDSVEFGYLGLDDAERYTRIRFEPRPHRLGPDGAIFLVWLAAGGRSSIVSIVSCHEAEREDALDFLRAFRDKRRALRALRARRTRIETSNSLFDEMLARSAADVDMLVTRTESGPYPYAGIPWFSTVFGRDGIITAMLLLWADPSIARGVLGYLAATQAHESLAEADAQPGKILHERRQGEMARTGEVPFRRYYGSVDATPLFVLLAGLYFERTGDLVGIRTLWPNIEAALEWCDHYGDRDGDGFVEYFRETDKGLANQGWKDSHDAIFHADGASALGPIALCEVQAYVYAAKRQAAAMATALGDSALSAKLAASAEILRARFEEAFWCEEQGTYAMALDGEKRACRVRSSNAGHALFAGIASPGRARRVADNLLSMDGASGWGIRTIARGEPHYNPMSYHNGSVWPHDNALIALGFARYGLKQESLAVLNALFDVAMYQDLHRLPELFCGFRRRPRRGPTAYPVACAPQAWAAAAPFGVIGACLGLRFLPGRGEIRFVDPVMPPYLDEIVLRDLCLGAASVDVALRRHGSETTLTLLGRRGSCRVVLEI